MRWPWETSKDYRTRVNARTARIQARQEGRSSRVDSREDARAAGGYYDPASVAARQGTVQAGMDAGLSAAEGIAQAFGYDVDLDGSSSAAAPARTSVATSPSSSSSFGGLDQQTMLIVAALAIGGVFLLSRK